jgi:hypothetical protein
MTQDRPTDQRARTIGVAAMLHATGPDGRVDPLAFEAQRLILEHESIDGVRAKDLAAALPTAAKQAGLDARALADAVCLRLPHAVAQRVRDAIAGRAPRRKAGALDGLSRALGWKYWFRAKPGSDARWPEHPGLTGMTPQGIAEARRRTAQAYVALRGYVDPEEFRAAGRAEQSLRDMIIGTAMMYADLDKALDEYDRTGSVADPVRLRAATVLAHWNKGAKDAVAAGRGEAFAAEAWDIGLDAAVCAMPAADFWKLGGVAKSYLRKGVDMNDPAMRAVLNEAGRLSAERASRQAASS